ncbi:heme-binding protein [Oceanisphaera sediminis]
MTYLKQTAWITLAIMMGMGNAMATEEAEYRVIRQDNRFELREYASHIIAETLVGGDFDDAGSKAFGRLFKYISGNNTSSQSIDMTAPVSQQAEGEKIDMTSPVGQQRVNDRWAISFMMPAAYSLETLPTPNDPNITLRQVPARHMAAVTYSGLWNEKNYRQHKEQLDAWINKNGFSVVGEPIWARYNPPFMPWFLRRNEILVPVAPPQSP